jgi:hypothetical protein
VKRTENPAPHLLLRENSVEAPRAFLIDRNARERSLRLSDVGWAWKLVCSARNTDTGEKCAIKKIANAFENVTDARRTLREIKLLRHLSHENIISVKDIMPPPSRTDFKDVYLVYELMDTDLHQIIRSSQPLTDDHSQYFVYQVRDIAVFPRPPHYVAPTSLPREVQLHFTSAPTRGWSKQLSASHAKQIPTPCQSKSKPLPHTARTVSPTIPFPHCLCAGAFGTNQQKCLLTALGQPLHV